VNVVALTPSTGATLDFDALMRLQHLGRTMASRTRGPLTSLPGGFVHRKRGRGLEVNDIRPWQHGDDIRHIDRNATARTSVPHVRTFRDERDRSLLLVADFRPSMLFGTRRAFRSVAAAEALALIGWHASAEGGRIGLIAAGPTETASTAPRRGVRQMATVLGMLTRSHADAVESRSRADLPLASVLETAARLVASGGCIVVATALDEPGDDFDAVVHWLARRNDLRFAIIRDAFEREPPEGLYPFVTAAGRKGTIRIGRDHRAAADRRCAHLRSFGASAIIVDSDAAPEALASTLEAIHV